MTVQDILEQPQSGIEGKQTPWDKFELPNTDRIKEPGLVLDASGSNAEPADQEESITKTELVCSALPEYIAATEGDDAMAAKEQSDGSSDRGGIRTFAFCYNAPIKFEPGEDESDDERDFRDWNTANNPDKIKAYQALVAARSQTFVAPALIALKFAYDAEFVVPGAENYMPEPQRPCHMILGVGDGKFMDPSAFDSFLEELSEARCMAFAAIGFGDAHNEFVEHLKTIAKKNAFFTYAALTGVGNFREVGMALRLLSGSAPTS